MRYRAVLVDPELSTEPDPQTLSVPPAPTTFSHVLGCIENWAQAVLKKAGKRAVVEVFELREQPLCKFLLTTDGRIERK